MTKENALRDIEEVRNALDILAVIAVSEKETEQLTEMANKLTDAFERLRDGD